MAHPQLWQGRYASQEYRRRGSRDVYLTERYTGAQAAVGPTGKGDFIVSLPGVIVMVATRRRAFELIEEVAVALYLGEMGPEIVHG